MKVKAGFVLFFFSFSIFGISKVLFCNAIVAVMSSSLLSLFSLSLKEFVAIVTLEILLLMMFI